MKRLKFVFLLLLFIPGSFAQSVLTIEKLEHDKGKNTLKEDKKEVGFSALAEGKVQNPDLEVYVLVKGESEKGWRLFPATVSPDPESKGSYRWRAICLFGKHNDKPAGEAYQIQAVALDRTKTKDGISARGAITGAPKTEIISVTRTK